MVGNRGAAEEDDRAGDLFRPPPRPVRPPEEPGPDDGDGPASGNGKVVRPAARKEDRAGIAVSAVRPPPDGDTTTVKPGATLPEDAQPARPAGKKSENGSATNGSDHARSGSSTRSG